MKVVLFCGGKGMRLRDYSDNTPKPMITIGYRPIIWHLMKYYAHYGHKEFILCLGYKADVIKDYFINYKEYLSNDFTLSDGGRNLRLHNSDISDWSITFADTGTNSNIGERLKAVEKYLEGEEMFLANYADGLTDLPLPELLDFSMKAGKTACFLNVRPNQSFHLVNADEYGRVRNIEALTQSDIWINGGYFVFKKDIFRYIGDGEELIFEPFSRLIEKRELVAYRYDGFWMGMDTFKEKQLLDELYEQGNPPWVVWNGTEEKARCRSRLLEPTGPQKKPAGRGS